MPAVLGHEHLGSRCAWVCAEYCKGPAGAAGVGEGVLVILLEMSLLHYCWHFYTELTWKKMFLGRHVLFLCQECSSQGIGKGKADSPASGLYPTQAGYRRTSLKKYTLQGRLPLSPQVMYHRTPWQGGGGPTCGTGPGGTALSVLPLALQQRPRWDDEFRSLRVGRCPSGVIVVHSPAPVLASAY